VQVGFWEAGLERDGVHAGAFEPMTGKFILCGLENDLFVLLTNTASRLAIVGGDFKGHRFSRAIFVGAFAAVSR